MLGLMSGGAWGITINISGNGGSNTATAAKPTCTGYVDSNPYQNCTSNAFVTDTQSLAGNDGNFKNAFDAWNNTLAAGSKWTLVNGGALPGNGVGNPEAIFDVTTFSTSVGATIGDMTISVNWTYTGADKADYVWSQGLFDNYTITPPAIVPGFYEMDNNGSTTTPAYPYQYGDRHFYDKPAAPMPNGQFEAWAMVTKVNTTTRTLTAYEGITYGFTLSATPVPEPASYAMVLVGLMLLLAMRRSRRLGV